VVNFLRRKKAKMTISELADYFKVERRTMSRMLKGIYKDREHYSEYKGFDREYVDMRRENGTLYKCLVYFVKGG